MPDYDYDEYTRRHEEYLERKDQMMDEDVSEEPAEEVTVASDSEDDIKGSLDAIEDDLSW